MRGMAFKPEGLVQQRLGGSGGGRAMSCSLLKNLWSFLLLVWKG